jgi:hypothetical protein
MHPFGLAFRLYGGAFLKGRHNMDETQTGQIPKEVAAADFDRFCGMARLDRDRPRNSNDRRDLEDDCELFIYRIMVGEIEVDDEGYPTVHTESEALPRIRFGRRPKVTALRAMDKCKSSNENGKMLAMMGDSLLIPSSKFNTLDYVDFERVSFVFGFFLG